MPKKHESPKPGRGDKVLMEKERNEFITRALDSLPEKNKQVLFNGNCDSVLRMCSLPLTLFLCNTKSRLLCDQYAHPAHVRICCLLCLFKKSISSHISLGISKSCLFSVFHL